MEVTVNQKKYILQEASSIEEMLSIVLPSSIRNIAVAVNQSIVSKSNWPEYMLKQGDQVLLIKATQGG